MVFKTERIIRMQNVTPINSSIFLQDIFKCIFVYLYVCIVCEYFGWGWVIRVHTGVDCWGGYVCTHTSHLQWERVPISHTTGLNQILPSPYFCTSASDCHTALTQYSYLSFNPHEGQRRWSIAVLLLSSSCSHTGSHKIK